LKIHFTQAVVAVEVTFSTARVQLYLQPATTLVVNEFS